MILYIEPEYHVITEWPAEANCFANTSNPFEMWKNSLLAYLNNMFVMLAGDQSALTVIYYITLVMNLH